jgi:hypothetical protein
LLALFVTAVAIKTFPLPWGETRKALSVWSRSAFGAPRRQEA